jgi:hypothetical protein
LLVSFLAMIEAHEERARDINGLDLKAWDSHR